MSENWLDKIFGPSDFEFDYSKYSTETLIKVFRLNEPKIITVIRNLIYTILAVVALVVLSIGILLTLPSNKSTPVGPTYDNVLQNEFVEESQSLEEDKSSEETIVKLSDSQSSVDITTDTDWFESDSDSSQSNSNNSSNVLNFIFGLIFDNIYESVKDIFKDVGVIITNPDSEEAMQIMENYREFLKGIVNDSNIIDNNTKRVVINYIDELDLDPVKINNTATEILQTALDGVNALNQAITTISEATLNGRILSEKEVIVILNSFFDIWNK